MPVSKKRKKKRSSPPPSPPKSKVAASAPKKKKLTRQQILIYVISGLMILSLAIGFVVGSGRRSQPVPTDVPQSTILLETPAPTGQATATVEPTSVEPTSVEPTSAN